MEERERLEQAITHLEAQRSLLGDAVVDASIAVLREKLASLDAPLPPAALRKQATVLFADVSGFTAMSESMDAEDVNQVMNTLWGQMDRIITTYGGRIDKHMGDAVMALWGAEESREDDAERAIRAALEMQAAPAKIEASSFPRITLRIGIHTGPVFLGTLGTIGEYTAIGDTVNTASRLQREAPTGGILVSQDTYHHVRGVFDVQILEPIPVKGKIEPLQAYLVQRLKPRAFRPGTRGLEGIRTRMIGRDAELLALQTALKEVLQSGQSRWITILGEPGLGKSRLLYEFENWVELQPERLRLFKGRAGPEMQNLPYALLRDLISFRFQIQESDLPTEVKTKLEVGVAAALGENENSTMRAHFIGQLLGFDIGRSSYLPPEIDPRQLRDRAILYLGEYFQSMAAVRPTAIFLEDIHWADSSSLAVIETLAQTLAENPLLLISLARPVLYERQAQWGAASSRHACLTLTPLSKDASRSLVEAILQKAADIPAALRELVVSSAEGIPYYVEELIKMLIEDGVIIKDDESWRIEASRLVRVRVPSTLAGIIQARLDGLPPAERAVLQQASVIGRTFWDGAVAYLGAAVPGDNVAPETAAGLLQALCERELIFRRASSAFSEEHEYIFKHAILREVTYESVLKRDRRRYHARVAAWLIEHSGARVGEYAGVIADHHELAGQAEQAVAYLRQAGERAARQFDNTAAITYYTRALKLAPEADAARRYAILLAREGVYDLQGMRAEQMEDLNTLRALAEALPGDEETRAGRLAAVSLRWANYGEMIGDYPLAIASAQAAIEKALLAGDVAQEAQAYLLWGRDLWRQGSHADAQTRCWQALQLARKNGLAQIEANSLRTLGAIAFHQGDYARVQEPYEQALRIYHEIGDRRGAGSAMNNLGDIARQQGDYARSRQYFEQAAQNSREIGDRWGEGIALVNLSLVFHTLGEQDAAREQASQALQLARKINSRSIEGFACRNLAYTLEASGDLDEARQFYQKAASLHGEIGEIVTQMESLSGAARVALRQGNPASALATVEQILCFVERSTLDGSDEPFRVYLTCYHILKACGDQRSAGLLHTAYQLLQGQAARISDSALQHSFLTNVAAHAEIVAEWATHHEENHDPQKD